MCCSSPCFFYIKIYLKDFSISVHNPVIFLLLHITPFLWMHHNLFNSTANSSQSFIEAKHASVSYSVNTARIFFLRNQVLCGSQAPRWLLIILFCWDSYPCVIFSHTGWSLALGKASHHVMRTLKLPSRRDHRERSWGFQPMAVPICQLCEYASLDPPALVKTSCDYSPQLTSDFSLIIDSKSIPPSQDAREHWPETSWEILNNYVVLHQPPTLGIVIATAIKIGTGSRYYHNKDLNILE